MYACHARQALRPAPTARNEAAASTPSPAPHHWIISGDGELFSIYKPGVIGLFTNSQKQTVLEIEVRNFEKLYSFRLLTKRFESRKNPSNSRKCFLFKPFSVFNSVLLTAIRCTLYALSSGNCQTVSDKRSGIRSMRNTSGSAPGSSGCRKRRRSPARHRK